MLSVLDYRIGLRLGLALCQLYCLTTLYETRLLATGVVNCLLSLINHAFVNVPNRLAENQYQATRAVNCLLSLINHVFVNVPNRLAETQCQATWVEFFGCKTSFIDYSSIVQLATMLINHAFVNIPNRSAENQYQASWVEFLVCIASFIGDIKTHGKSRGQEEASLRNEPVSYLQVAPL